jgi:hypothetical protein
LLISFPLLVLVRKTDRHSSDLCSPIRNWNRNVRASLSVCQNLLCKSCVLPTSKKLCKIKKRIHLQQFGIIHLPNPYLTYIRNPGKNKIMYVPFHLLKKLTSGILLYSLFLFHPPT